MIQYNNATKETLKSYYNFLKTALDSCSKNSNIATALIQDGSYATIFRKCGDHAAFLPPGGYKRLEESYQNNFITNKTSTSFVAWLGQVVSEFEAAVANNSANQSKKDDSMNFQNLKDCLTRPEQSLNIFSIIGKAPKEAQELILKYLQDTGLIKCFVFDTESGTIPIILKNALNSGKTADLLNALEPVLNRVKVTFLDIKAITNAETRWEQYLNFVDTDPKESLWKNLMFKKKQEWDDLLKLGALDPDMAWNVILKNKQP